MGFGECLSIAHSLCHPQTLITALTAKRILRTSSLTICRRTHPNIRLYSCSPTATSFPVARLTCHSPPLQTSSSSPSGATTHLMAAYHFLVSTPIFASLLSRQNYPHLATNWLMQLILPFSRKLPCVVDTTTFCPKLAYNFDTSHILSHYYSYSYATVPYTNLQLLIGTIFEPAVKRSSE